MHSMPILAITTQAGPRGCAHRCCSGTDPFHACRALGSSQDVGPRLRRGYQTPPEGVITTQIDAKAEAVDDAAARQPVTRLLLCVHGIGQNLSGEPGACCCACYAHYAHYPGPLLAMLLASAPLAVACCLSCPDQLHC